MVVRILNISCILPQFYTCFDTGHGCILEHLESSGTKTMKKEPPVYARTYNFFPSFQFCYPIRRHLKGLQINPHPWNSAQVNRAET